MNDPTPPPWSRSKLVPTEVNRLYKKNGPLAQSWHPERIRKMNNIGKAITTGFQKQAIAPLLGAGLMAAARPVLGRLALGIGTDLAAGAAANKIRSMTAKKNQPQQPQVKTAGVFGTAINNAKAQYATHITNPVGRSVTRAKISRGIKAAGKHIGMGILLPAAADTVIRAAMPQPKNREEE